MAPPSYSDIDKCAKDLLSKKFTLGNINLQIKRYIKNAEIITSGSQHLHSKQNVVEISSKYNIAKCGLSVNNTAKSNCSWITELVFDDSVMKGLKNTFKITLEPQIRNTRAELSNSYKNENLNSNLGLNFKNNSADVSSNFVVGYDSYLAGVDLGLDSQTKRLAKANFAVALSTKDFTFCGSVMNWAKQYSASVYQKITDRTEVAGQVGWNRELSDINWSIGSSYNIDKNAGHTFKWKLDNLMRLSLSLTTNLSRATNLSVCTTVTANDLPQIGLAFEL